MVKGSFGTDRCPDVTTSHAGRQWERIVRMAGTRQRRASWHETVTSRKADKCECPMRNQVLLATAGRRTFIRRERKRMSDTPDRCFTSPKGDSIIAASPIQVNYRIH